MFFKFAPKRWSKFLFPKRNFLLVIKDKSRFLIIIFDKRFGVNLKNLLFVIF